MDSKELPIVIKTYLTDNSITHNEGYEYKLAKLMQNHFLALDEALFNIEKLSTTLNKSFLFGFTRFFIESYFNNITFNDCRKSEKLMEKNLKLYEDAVKIVSTHRVASASFLQRRLGVSYNEAMILISKLEASRIIGPAEGDKQRKVLVPPFK